MRGYEDAPAETIGEFEKGYESPCGVMRVHSLVLASLGCWLRIPMRGYETVITNLYNKYF